LKTLFNFLIAVFVWLGLFELHLVKPLLTQPFTTAIRDVTFIDLCLLAVTAVVVIAILTMIDRMIDSRKARAAAHH